MSNPFPDHLKRLRQGVEVWNAWRATEPSATAFFVREDLGGISLPGADLHKANFNGANLSGADLNGADLSEAWLRRVELYGAGLRMANLNRADLQEASLVNANLKGADLTGADLSKANLREANLSGANLSGADLSWVNLFLANLSEANLSKAHLNGAYLNRANLSRANLKGASLRTANLVQTDLTDADLTNCRIFGASAWDTKLNGAKQQDLVITDYGEPTVTADDIEVAQFIHLLLHNEKLQRVVDTITTKVVLILGRFSLPERKTVLDALRDELRKPRRNYVPVVFDFEKPRSSNHHQHRDAAFAHGAVRDRRHLRRQKRVAGAAGDRAK